MTFSEITTHIQNKLGEEIILEIQQEQLMPLVYIHPENIEKIGHFLHTDESLYFDLLSCISGIDYGQEKSVMEVAYNFYSIPYNHHYCVKVSLSRNNSDEDPMPEVPTLSNIWKTALWQERETYDFFGIHFKGHPDLRRILLPADWEGYPLRKDYKEQDYYHGVKVVY